MLLRQNGSGDLQLKESIRSLPMQKLKRNFFAGIKTKRRVISNPRCDSAVLLWRRGRPALENQPWSAGRQQIPLAGAALSAFKSKNAAGEIGVGFAQLSVDGVTLTGPGHTNQFKSRRKV
jgi:hypothetical protein